MNIRKTNLFIGQPTSVWPALCSNSGSEKIAFSNEEYFHSRSTLQSLQLDYECAFYKDYSNQYFKAAQGMSKIIQGHQKLNFKIFQPLGIFQPPFMCMHLMTLPSCKRMSSRNRISLILKPYSISKALEINPSIKREQWTFISFILLSLKYPLS